MGCVVVREVAERMPGEWELAVLGVQAAISGSDKDEMVVGFSGLRQRDERHDYGDVLNDCGRRWRRKRWLRFRIRVRV